MGQTAVEFTLVAIVFFSLVFGIFEGGRYIYGVNSVTNAAREAARWGIATSNSCDSTQPGMQAAALQAMQGIGTFSFSNPPWPATGNYAHAAGGTGNAGDYCEVTVQWTFLPAAGAFGFPKATVTTTSRQYNN
jgi:Flp pilus assembly protein TadG